MSDSTSDDDLDMAGHPLSHFLSQIDAFALHNAAEVGNVDKLRLLLSSGEVPAAEGATQQVAFGRELAARSLRMRDDDGCNPLHLAIVNVQAPCVELLLSNGSSPDTACDGNPPLCMAACVAHLKDGSTAAVAMIEMLIKAGADVFDRDDGGRTALHWASTVGLTEAVPQLLSAAVESRERRMAAYLSDMEAVKAAQAAVAAAEAAEGGSATLPPMKLMEPPSLPYLPTEADSDGNTALHLAARFGQQSVLRLLLQEGQGWDVSALTKIKNKEGYCALHLAALYNHSSAAEVLAEASGGCGRADKKGRTAAELALKRGHKGLAHALSTQFGRKPSDSATDMDTATPAPSTVYQTLILAPDECALHRTAPEPIVRGGKEPPPENVHRLKVLVDPSTGILRSTEFQACGWETSGIPSVAMSDLMRIHDWSYVRGVAQACSKVADHPGAVGHLDADTAISHHSYDAALKAAGAVCVGVDRVVTKQARNAFCAVRPPGHHAGPTGVVHNPSDPASSSHGFCLFSNIAIGAAYAMNQYRHQGIKRVAILDFDVHHGNGTEAVVINSHPSLKRFPFSTPFSEGTQVFPTYKPWHDVSDSDNILFASVQGYGKVGGGWFYPGTGATADSAPAKVAPAAAPAAVSAPAVASAEEQEEAAKASAPADSGRAPEDPDGEFKATTNDNGDATSSGASRGAAGPRIIDVGVPGPGAHRPMWRRAWRDKILPALVNFKPDMVFVSAGFDAHKKDYINGRFCGVTEADYEWLTDQIMQVANKCCEGRVVSVLEGGYNLRGGIVSAFARSVASHVRALTDGTTQAWDPADSKLEREMEAKRKEAVRAAAALRSASLALAATAQAQAPLDKAAAPSPSAGAAAGGVGQGHTATDEAVTPSSVTGAAVAAAGAADVSAPAAAPAAAAGASDAEPNAKRSRRGGGVDYAALNAKMEEERKVAAVAVQNL